jgi:hypothetical protein
MKIRLRAIPVQYNDGFRTIKCALSGKALLDDVVLDVKDATELEAAVLLMRQQVRESAEIFTKPLGRKFRGYDKFCDANRKLFEVGPEDIATGLQGTTAALGDQAILATHPIR